MKRDELSLYISQATIGLVLVTVWLVAFAAISVVISFGLIGPNLAAIANIIVSLLIGVPLTYILFPILFCIEKLNWYKYILPALVLPIVFGCVIGITMLERQPENIFRVFITKPIPNGISNIRAQDISVGIDDEIVVAFNTTAEAVEEIISKEGFEFAGISPSSNSPHGFFPDLNWNDQLDVYVYNKCVPQQYCKTMWLNPEQAIVLYSYRSH